MFGKIVGVLFCCLSLSLQAQNPYFSQYYASPLYLNPSLAAAHSDVSFGINYRSQWNSDNSPYQMGQFSIIYPILKKGALLNHLGGVGLSLFQDLAGENKIFKTYGVNITGSYKLSLNPSHTVLMGLQGGIIQKKIDYSNLRWGSQYNPLIGLDNRITPSVGEINEKVLFPVFDAGLFWHYTKQKSSYNLRSRSLAFYSGVAVANINKPDESVFSDGTSRLPMLFKFHGGLEYRSSRSFKFTPGFLIMQQNENRQFNVGSYLTHTIISDPYSRQPKTFDLQAGIWYRVKDSFIFMVGGSSKDVSLGFSYDMNTTSMRYNNLGVGAYEISLTYKIKKGEEIRSFSTPLM